MVFFGYKKAQAALEFLTTYVWAFVIILITVGALYYFGVFDFAQFRPQECIFTSQFECLDFSFAGSEVRFRLLNNVGNDITVSGVSITNDAVTPLSCTSPSSFSWQSGNESDFVLTSCSGGGFLPGEFVEAKVSFTYFAPSTPSQPEHTVRGKIHAVVR